MDNSAAKDKLEVKGNPVDYYIYVEQVKLFFQRGFACCENSPRYNKNIFINLFKKNKSNLFVTR